MKKHRIAAMAALVWVGAVACLGQYKIADTRFGGSDIDYLRVVRVTPDGGAILGGTSFSGIGGDKSEASRGHEDYWIVKVNGLGVKEWDRTFGGDAEDSLYGLWQTTDGGYILGGYSVSGISGDRTVDSRGYGDYWVVKTDTNGVKQWDRRYGGGSEDELFCLQQTSDGGYIFGGDSYSWASGEKTEGSRGYNDFWIVKTATNGVREWDRTLGGSGSDRLWSLQQTPDGGYILGGYSSSGVGNEKTEPCRGSWDFWLVKVTTNGVKQWDRTFGGSGFEEMYCVHQTADGGYIFGGYSDSPADGDKSEPSRGSKDFWVVKTDTNGVKQWDRTFGGSSQDSVQSVQQTADGGYILGGYSYSSAGGDKSEPSRGQQDYWVVKLDSFGRKQWDKTLGGSNGDTLQSVQPLPGGMYLAGGFSLSGVSGERTQPSRGQWDYWLVLLMAFHVELELQGTNAVATWDATEGYEYTLQYVDGLSNGAVWRNVDPTNRLGVPPVMRGTNWGGGARPQRIYRVVAE